MMDAAAQAGAVALLIAPTGGGKTLAGFLPSLIDLAAAPAARPAHALCQPAEGARDRYRPQPDGPGRRDAASPSAIETRTGDTPHANRRQRQKENPPNLLLTTPESLALLLSQPDAPALFAASQTVVMDEVHALAGTKRGDQLALCLARLARLAPGLRRVGLSATVAHPAGAPLAWRRRPNPS